MDDHYATLRVRPDAGQREIERSYRRLARTYHPDLLRGVSPEARRRAEDTLKRVNQAYGVIGDPRRRGHYDRERARRHARPSARPPHRPRPAETTTHWQAGGPLDIEWETPLPRQPRPADTDVFSPGRLARWSAAIVLFTLFLALLGRPIIAPAEPPSPPTPTIAQPGP